jgi:hypothetical protein
VESGFAPDTPWLELIVVDSGMGMGYPAHQIWARQSGSQVEDLYSTPAFEEQRRLFLVLNEPISTKGKWGKAINLQTSTGEGTIFIRDRLGGVGGYAAVRAGRSLAHWYTATRTFDHLHRRASRREPYTVVQQEYSPFFGTAWQILIPLETQFGLNIPA